MVKASSVPLLLSSIPLDSSVPLVVLLISLGFVSLGVQLDKSRQGCGKVTHE